MENPTKNDLHNGLVELKGIANNHQFTDNFMDMYRLRDGNLNLPCNEGTVDNINNHFMTLTQQLRNVSFLCDTLKGTDMSQHSIDNVCYEDTLYHNFMTARSLETQTGWPEEHARLEHMFVAAVIMKLRTENQITNQFVIDLIKLTFYNHDHTRKPLLQVHNLENLIIHIVKSKTQFDIPKKYFTFDPKTTGTTDVLLKTIKEQNMFYTIIDVDDIEHYKYQHIPTDILQQHWLFPQDITSIYSA